MTVNTNLNKLKIEILNFIQTEKASLKTMNLAQKFQNLIQMELQICKV